MAKKSIELDAKPEGPKLGAGLSRLSITVDDVTGRIAWDRMRESSKAELFEKLKADPQIATLLDRPVATGPSPTVKETEVFNAAWAGPVFEVLGMVEVLIAVRLLGVTPDQAAILKYAEPERALLTGPLVRVLNKYESVWMQKYQDELMLAGLLVAVHLPKIQALQSPQVTQSTKVDISPRSDDPKPGSSNVAVGEFGAS